MGSLYRRMLSSPEAANAYRNDVYFRNVLDTVRLAEDQESTLYDPVVVLGQAVAHLAADRERLFKLAVAKAELPTGVVFAITPDPAPPKRSWWDRMFDAMYGRPHESN